MGVVIQEMVPADAAGVIFSRDPVNGNPENVVITANYGLGEVCQTSKLYWFHVADLQNYRQLKAPLISP